MFVPATPSVPRNITIMSNSSIQPRQRRSAGFSQRFGMDGGGGRGRRGQTAYFRPSLGCGGQERRWAETAEAREAGQTRRPAGSASSGLRGGRPRSVRRHSGRFGPGAAISSVACWSNAGCIPYGRTMSYGELAAKAGSPRAARAVGNCMAANKIPLLVPCHRVVCSGGRLGSLFRPRRHGDETPALGDGIAGKLA